MDLQDQRMSCIRMAIDMGCKPDAVVFMANSLMDFVTTGAVSAAGDAAAVKAVETVIANQEATESASQSVVAEAAAEPAGGKDESAERVESVDQAVVAEAAAEPPVAKDEAAETAAQPVAADAVAEAAGAKDATTVAAAQPIVVETAAEPAAEVRLRSRPLKPAPPRLPSKLRLPKTRPP